MAPIDIKTAHFCGARLIAVSCNTFQ